jgi:cell cycle sensor histidine kinase DivJ
MTTPPSENPTPVAPDAAALLNSLIADAQSGAIIPARLAGQLQAVADALGASAAPPAAPEPAPPAADGDALARLKTEQAAFFGHAIHELRTPMTAIRGYADMLGSDSMGPLNAMQKQFVETIRKNSRRMETLMTDVADMNKLRAGTLVPSPKMDMFKNIAMMIEKTHQPTADSLNVPLVFDLPQGLPLLNIDGELFARALGKLVENALRYTREDAADKTVTVRAAADGKTLVVHIIDHGIGMTADELRTLGTVYFRADHDAVRAHKGSGLGIPVAYGIFALLGAAAAVESTAGEGTTFTVRVAGMG